MPTWREFFEKLNTRIADKTTPQASCVQKLVIALGGELQKAVEREENFPLYEHDVVAPLIVRGTDISSAAERNALLEDQTANERACQYLLTG